MYAFDFVKPKTVEDAVAALGQEDAQAMAGGQTLLPTMKQRLASPSVVVSLTGIDALKYVRVEGDTVLVGGGATHAQIAEASAQAFPALASVAGRIGDPAVRHRGTAGGSLANNDPSACWPAAALGTGATVVTNSREIAADDYFQGMFTTALEPGEIITEIRFPIAAHAAYAKMLQPASRFPLTAAFVAKYDGGARVAVTGASEGGVFRWSEAEAALSADFSASAIADLAVPAEGMIGDVHGTPAYRAHLVGVMTRRAVAAAA